MRIFLISYTDKSRFEQPNDCGQHLFLLHAASFQVGIHPPADLGKCFDKTEHPFVFCLVPHRAKLIMISVLLAPPGIPPDRLDVPAGRGADPHVFPGWRDHQRCNSSQRIGIPDCRAVRA